MLETPTPWFSLFNCTNTHKYFVQLYGEGNNGKTTLMRILQTAFPIWVKMPSVEHLVVHGVLKRARVSQHRKFHR